MLNGPNLGRLGRRRPEVYGTTTLVQVEVAVREEVRPCGWDVVALQSNSEGTLIDALERHRDVVGAIVNPGALMMGGWALRDALEDFDRPWIEVHISNLWARESFRHQSITAGLASGVIVGLGVAGYRLAARALADLVAAG
jgi:5-deoxy-5-amino-3-dehydroquinate dehydratase